ncbi:MAG: autotransporter assembly complex protein TamA [Sphingomonas sp.]
MAAAAQSTGQVADSSASPAAQQTQSASPDASAGQAIIPDEQFQKDLPPLSSDINAPLEPMPVAPLPTPAPTQTEPVPAAQSTEAANRAAAQQAAGQNGAGQENGPVVSPQTTQQLSEPLAPLSTFDTVPLQTAQDVKNAQKAPEIHYDTVVTGLDQVDLAGKFKDLSALEDGDGKAENVAMIRARMSNDEDLAVRLMKSAGYYDGTAVATIAEEAGQAGRYRVTVDTTPGHLYRLGEIAIKAQPTVPPDLIRDALPLKTGDPIDAARVQGAEANVSVALPEHGYPFADVGTRDILLDGQTFTGDYTLPVDTGPRSSFGDIRLAGKRKVFNIKHIRELARFKRGELYDVQKVDDLRKALVATGLFRDVSVKPVKTGEPGPDDTQLAGIQVRQIPGPTHTLAGTAGYSTGQGFKVQGSWTSRNMFPPEGALILTAIGGSQEQGASATFRRSNAGKRDRTFSIVASADHNNYDAYDAFTGTLGINWSYDSTPIWQKKFTYAFGAQLIGTNESVYDFGRDKRVRRTYGILAVPLQAVFDQSNDLLNPTHGYRVKLKLSPESSVHGAIKPYVRSMVEADGYFPVTDSLVLAGRAAAGSIFGIDRDDLAPSRRYYGGGGGSVRGYGYQRLGPFDPNGDPIGGRSINEFSVEARYRFGNFGVVPFVDAGNAYASELPKFNDLRFGAGIGGRFYTNFGPVRVDVATPLNPRKGDGRIAVYISIGQAF